MLQKLPVTDFKRIKEKLQFNEHFLKIYNEDSAIGYFIETEVLFSENLHERNNDLPILLEKIKIKKFKKS